MGVHNEDVGESFDEMADLLAIVGENPFRVRAYRRAAQVVRSLPHDVCDLRDVRALDDLPGIGADLAGKISELCRTGHMPALEALRGRVRPGVRELLRLPGLGPVRVRSLSTRLGIRNIGDLERALASDRLTEVAGFGPGITARLRAALAEDGVRGAQRMSRPIAARYAEPLQRYLQALPGVTRVEIAGSYRRGRDTVGDLDIVVCGRRGRSIFEALRRYEDLRELMAAGATRATGVLRNGLQIDVRVVPPASFGAALHYFTGSRDHNVHARRSAQARGLKLNEYGLFRGKRRVAGRSEEELFSALGLPWIAPELREDRGEIEAAERHALPALIEAGDLVGDLHVHTDASDGRAPLEEMASAARARGLEYVAITDHSKHMGIVKGLDARRLARQIDAIDAFNERRGGIVLLKGAEVDILDNGKLALTDSILRRLDLVVVSLHTHLDLPEAKQTARVLRALERPCVSILAHPSARLLGERPPCKLDFDRVLRAAHERPCYLEINGQPRRLDLDDVHVKAARDAGVLVSIASDAHAPAELAYVDNGIRQARRGWLTRDEVLNARPLRELRTLLRWTLL